MTHRPWQTSVRSRCCLSAAKTVLATNQKNSPRATTWMLQFNLLRLSLWLSKCEADCDISKTSAYHNTLFHELMIHDLNPHDVLLRAQSSGEKIAKYQIAAYDEFERQVWCRFPTFPKDTAAGASESCIGISPVCAALATFAASLLNGGFLYLRTGIISSCRPGISERANSLH